MESTCSDNVTLIILWISTVQYCEHPGAIPLSLPLPKSFSDFVEKGFREKRSYVLGVCYLSLTMLEKLQRDLWGTSIQLLLQSMLLRVTEYSTVLQEVRFECHSWALNTL